MSNVNPNSRSPFVDSRGHLTKYGMDVIALLYRLLSVQGDGSSLVDELDTGVAEMQAAKSRADLRDINQTLTAIAAEAQDHTLRAQINAVLTRVSALEASMGEVIPWKQILQRLDAIEAQL